MIESWETRTGRGLAPIPNASAGSIGALAFSPDGTLLALAGTAGRISVWDFSSRTLKFPLDGHSGVATLVFSADGTHLYSGGGDGTIREWDVPTQRATGMWRLPYAGSLDLALAPDGKSIISAKPDEIRIFAPEPREEATVLQVRSGWSWPVRFARRQESDYCRS